MLPLSPPGSFPPAQQQASRSFASVVLSNPNTPQHSLYSHKAVSSLCLGDPFQLLLPVLPSVAYTNMVVPNDSSKDTRTSQRRTGRTQKRSTITPSPNSHKKEEEDEEDEDEPLVRLRRDQDTKPAASKRPKRAAASTATSATTSHRTTPKNINDVLQQDARTFQLEAARLSIKKGNLKKDVDDDDDERRCVPCVSNKTNAFLPSDVSNGVAVAPRNGAHGNDHPVDDDDDDDDDDNDEDEDDRPFTVEYASSSRSTCRRCDAVIAKGALRISHVPLFRGKPGYRVYRHLPCAVFSEEIEKVQDVGGWNRIDPLDLEQLRQRIQDSQLELEQENEDLDPDELVQKGFQGEIRSTPLGFVGTQLPFQIEGQSWMYHQEVHVPEIRGGILADEMGMVCFVLVVCCSKHACSLFIVCHKIHVLMFLPLYMT